MKIRRLTLFTPQLAAQRAFYTEVLELPLVEQQANWFEVQVGTSILRFEGRPASNPAHYAINIPSNQIEAAAEWLAARTELLAGPDGNRIHRFDNWDAWAVYFYDADGNIGELIARNRLGVHSDAPFSVPQLLHLSEAALGKVGLNSEIESLLNEGMAIHSGSAGRFCSMGDPEGLFILVNTAQKGTWFPTMEPILPANWKAEVEIEGKSLAFAFEDGRFFRQTYS